MAAGCNTAAADEPPFVVSEHVTVPPKHKTQRKHFTPWDNPSVGQIHLVAHSERKRWGGPSIIGRIACESGFRPKVVNGGGYAGLLQIGSIWSYLASGLPRDVTLVTYYHRKAPILRHRHWSNGKWTHHLVRNRRQVVKLIRTGTIRNASPLHGYAAIRVGQRAVSPRGYPTTGWSCGL